MEEERARLLPAREDAQAARERGAERRLVAWEDLRRVVEEEDKIDFAFRELRFHLFFFVLVVPFFVMQGHTVARFQTLEHLRNLIERKAFYTGFPAELTARQPPPFWFPQDTGANATRQLKALTFAQVSDEGEYWDWVTQIVGQGVFFPQFAQRGIAQTAEEAFWYFANETLAADVQAQYAARQARALHSDMVLLEGARLRSLRVEAFDPKSSTAASRLQGLKRYPPFTDDVEATSLERYGPFSSRFGASNSSQPSALPSDFFPTLSTFAYSWEQSETLKTRSVQGDFATYPGNGFVVSLPLDTSSWYATASRLSIYRNGVFNLTEDDGLVPSGAAGADQASTLFSAATRAVILSMTFYNGNTNLYSFVECVLESSATGTFRTFVNYYIAPQPGKGASSQPLDGAATAEVAFASLAFAYMVACFVRFFRNFNWYRHGTPWIVVELATLCLYGISFTWIVRAYYLTGDNPLALPARSVYRDRVYDPFWVCTPESPSLAPNASATTQFLPCGGQPPISEDFALWAKDYTDMQFVFAVILLLGCLKLIRYMLQFWRFRLITETLRKASWDLLYFLIIFSIMYVGYSLSGFLFYQAGTEHFATVARSTMYTLLNFIRVDTAYYALVNVNVYASVFTPVYFFSFFFVFVWTFASVLLAILYNAWNSVKDAAYARERKTWSKRTLHQDLLALFSVGDNLQKNPYAEHSRTSLRVSLRYICHRNPERRRLGRERLCEFACARPKRGWLDKETALLHLKLWKLRPENAHVNFLDQDLLQAALGRKACEDQVAYYMDLLRDSMYSKVEADQKDMQLKLQREGGGRAHQPSLSLLTRNSIATSISNLSKTQDAWLMQVDSYLAHLRGSHAQNVRALGSLARDAEILAVYGRGMGAGAAGVVNRGA